MTPAQSPPSNRLSSLPQELQLHIAHYLDCSDVCHVSAASRGLKNTFPDPLRQLNDELSRAWTEIDRVFGAQYHVTHRMQLWPSTIGNKTIEQRVHEHAVACGYSRLVVRWIVHPEDHRFSCSKCRALKPWSDFPRNVLHRLYPFQLRTEAKSSRLSYKQILDDFQCGECIAVRQPTLYHVIGAHNKASMIIKCHKCHVVKRAARDIPFRLFSSGMCEECFKEINQDWFKYKSFLRECLTSMEQYELGGNKGTFAWKGLPACPVSPEFVASLSPGERRPLPNYLEMAFPPLRALPGFD